MTVTAVIFSEPPAQHQLKIFRERHDHRRGAARVNHKQCHPTVEKSDRRMIGRAQVRILTAYLRHAVGKFGVDKRPNERDCAAHDPRGKNQYRCVDNLGDDVRIDKNPRANDPAHDDHRGVKQIEFCGKAGSGTG